MKTQALEIDRETLLAQTLRGEFPDARGRFGPFGGRYVPETLVPALDRLDGNGNLPFAVDFRSLQATAIERWWGLAASMGSSAALRPLDLLRA